MSEREVGQWRSLDELTSIQSSAAEPQLARGALQPAQFELGEIARRDLLRLMGASLALAGASACTRQPDEMIYPYAKQPESLIPGVPIYFATAMPWPSGALGLLVESHMGRPTKVEGNPDHPASLGATDVFAQAAVLELYDPDRSQVVRERGAISTWSAFVTALVAAMEPQKAKQGAGLRILTETVTSPTLAQQLRDLLKQLPQARWHQWEPINRDEARAGAMLAFGQDVVAQHHFGQAEVVLSLDADFLSGPNGVLAMRQFAQARRGRKATPSVNRLYCAESSVSITGAKADHRLAVEPAVVAALASKIANALGIASQGRALDAKHDAWAAAVAKDLGQHRGKSLVVAGAEQPAEVHALAHAMNSALGNVGRTVDYTEPVECEPVDQYESLRRLVEDMQAGKVDLLVVLGGNPLYNAPSDSGLREAFDKVELRVHMSLHEDETSQHCHWHLPAAHFLESWSDARAHDGRVSIVQPLIAPLYGGRTAHEVVAALGGNLAPKPYDIVRAHWQSRGEDDDFEGYWRRALHDGVLAGRAFAPRSVALTGAPPSTAQFVADETATTALFRTDPSLYDGRFANNAWLQECARPLTKITWDNAVLVAPATAHALGLASEDEVELKLGATTVKATIWVTPGHAERCVTLPLGYGRTHAGNVGSRVGFDAFALRRVRQRWTAGGLEIEKTGRKHVLATTQKHHDMEHRDLIRVRELGQLEGEAEHGEGVGLEGANSIYAPVASSSPIHASWGMVIDLNACVGCNACVLACQSENNIPIVGPEEVARGREMHWIRIDRYYEGPVTDSGFGPHMLFQPVTCMHCENAPCEVVCPVGATTHSPEGLNEMTYNRCVGTKYCSNNCPYKVRRFNFFLYADFETESLKLQRNPDVSVRARGVMEKCTYCVQRINEKRIAAEKEDRPLRDGEIVTACQQVCPAQAITFGNIEDKDSTIAKLREEPHHYGLLTELNTRPRTTYLARLANENAELS
jgi:molybdopterin-containing oxidoreductase family iron-sulfur binding subunit